MEISYVIDNPQSLNKNSFNDFITLLTLQGQIGVPNINRINNCYFLCVAYDNKEPIGIGAIKHFYSNPFLYSESTVEQNKYKFELGYLFVINDEKYRSKGIGKEICIKLLDKVDRNKTYSTTDPNSNNTMVHILKKLGFEQLGKTYKGQVTGKDIGLFVYNI